MPCRCREALDLYPEINFLHCVSLGPRGDDNIGDELPEVNAAPFAIRDPSIARVHWQRVGMWAVVEVDVSIAARQWVIGRNERPYFAVERLFLLLRGNKLKRVEPVRQMVRAILNLPKVRFVRQTVKRVIKQVVPGNCGDAVMPV